MKALCVLYGGRLGPEAFRKILPRRAVPGSSPEKGNEDAFSLALAAGRSFPGTVKTVFLGTGEGGYPLPPETEAVYRPSWSRKSLLGELARLSAGFDLTYFAWADCPLLDPVLAGALAERHMRYGAEYSYADGWPYGFAPELLGPGTAGILCRIAGADDGPVERDSLFQVIQKDINAFDIETEISPVDLRPYRLTLTADSERNLILLSRLMEAGLASASGAEGILTGKPGLLRTLPAFFYIQVSGGCPQSCSFCPWPVYSVRAGGGDVTSRKDFMPRAAFEGLLDKIAGFAGDAVIGISLWGEPSLHPEKTGLIRAVLARPGLSLVVETSGLGWKQEELEVLSLEASNAVRPENRAAPLSWIVSLDAHDPARYKEVRGAGYAEARACAQTLLRLFPRNTYVQAVRVKGAEDDIEHFYRSWKSGGLPEGAAPAAQNDGSRIIIQKYDDFAGALPKMQASDLSPVKRRPCWHIQRDMVILMDGSVPACREDLGALEGRGDKPLLGNAFTGDLAAIWENGAALYREHCGGQYKGICGNCDEYYTYNF